MRLKKRGSHVKMCKIRNIKECYKYIMLKQFIGDRAFYKRLLVLALPIMVQNGITNLVNMVDNIMVGKLGTPEMTGVAVANQLLFVFNLCVFGACSGAGIFGAQFFGCRDHKGVRDTFRFRFVFCLLFTAAAIALFIFADEGLIGLYLKGEGSAETAAESLLFGKKYLSVMLLGLIPYTIAQCYSSVLRETGRSLPPMIAGVSAVCVNLILNYILIFGKFGVPKLGVIGAAIATVISRYVELAIVAGWTHRRKDINKFIVGAYRSLRVPKALIGDIMRKGMPLMLNEALWASGIAFINQCLSVKGQDVVAANNISQTFWNVFSVAFTAFGIAIGIILGQLLGDGKLSQVRDESRKLIAFTVFSSVAVAALYVPCTFIIPSIYNSTAEIKSLATSLMLITAFAMPIDAFAHSTYFTLRSGGKTFITFLFDSGFVWCITLPIAFILSRYTSVGVLPLFAITQFINIFKCLLGAYLVKRGSWIRNIVSDKKGE